MAEYFNREKAIDEFEQCNAKNPQWTPQRVKTLLLRIPTADVAPVVHAYWIEDGDTQICSNCGEEHEWDTYRANFCDNCGAKMDGGESDD